MVSKRMLTKKKETKPLNLRRKKEFLSGTHCSVSEMVKCLDAAADTDDCADCVKKHRRYSC